MTRKDKDAYLRTTIDYKGPVGIANTKTMLINVRKERFWDNKLKNFNFVKLVSTRNKKMLKIYPQRTNVIEKLNNSNGGTFLKK